jgi:hypothetical protein
LPPAAGDIAIAVGGDAMILAGASTAGAVLDAKTDRWRALPPLPTHVGRNRTWLHAVSISDHQVLAWAHWETQKKLGPNSEQLSGGTDLFSYDANTNKWTALATAAGAIPNVQVAFWTGTDVLVRGDERTCFSCSGPGPLPEVSASYDPKTDRWTALPADVLAPPNFGADNLSSVWTGAALWSFNASSSIGGQSFSVEPGDASVYDTATGRWRRLRRAPTSCATDAPLWTGHEVVLYCPSSTGADSGLAYVPAAP